MFLCDTPHQEDWQHPVFEEIYVNVRGTHDEVKVKTAVARHGWRLLLMLRHWGQARINQKPRFSFNCSSRSNPSLKFRIFETIGAVVNFGHELQLRTR